ncbi:MAG TPA: DM13 domain-containing protein [Acidimicrobiales bacterium]|jgi:hypothetical protein
MRPRLLVAGVVVAAAAGVAWFEPHKLFLDDTADEAAPAGTAAAAGTFRSLEHSTTGTASVLATSTDRRVLRFTDFETSNGPDLRVYLSTAAADADWKAFDDDFVELGTLKGNVGDQNYEIPAGTDLSRYKTAVVWCKRFSVPFAAADLKAS